MWNAACGFFLSIRTLIGLILMNLWVYFNWNFLFVVGMVTSKVGKRYAFAGFEALRELFLTRFSLSFPPSLPLCVCVCVSWLVCVYACACASWLVCVCACVRSARELLLFTRKKCNEVPILHTVSGGSTEETMQSTDKQNSRASETLAQTTEKSLYYQTSPS